MAALAIAAVGATIWRWRENGWGSLVWLASFVAISVIRSPFERATAENVITRIVSPRLESALLAGVMAGSAIVPLVHFATGALSFTNYELPHWATTLGVVLLVCGLVMFRQTHVDLGRNWSVRLEVRDEHTLVTSGVYSRVRHPMYTAIFLMYASAPLLVHNWIAGFAPLAAFTLMVVLRVPREERMMAEQFGDAYREYRRSTGALLPRLRRP